MTITNALRFAGITLAAFLFGMQFAVADNHMADDRISDVVNTKHNFSAIANPELPTNDKGVQVKAATQKEVCVFCHTPHGDPIEGGKAFLWNHKASSQTYTNYSSSSMDATIGDPGEASKMCLSCHDGTVAVGAVDVFNGKLASDQTPSAIEMSGDGQSAGLIVDSGTGYNSNLGTDLRNDHPIGFAYTSSVAAADKELVDPDPSVVDYIGPRQNRLVTNWNNAINETNDLPSTRKAVPLEASLTTALSSLSAGTLATFGGGTVECTTCHDPHIRSTTNDHNIKFLRLNRFQEGSPSGGSFSINQDINCLACHKKAGWSTSAHGSITHANEIYDDTAADDREFPRGIKVSEASCLNCHDAHTEKGARYLLREGADASSESAIENTCFQCHSSSSILADGNDGAKDIKTLVDLTNGHTMDDFQVSNTHDITDSDLSETQTSLRNLHITCTDCHNPHRLIKNEKYDNTGGGSSSLHTHDLTGTTEHDNIASGALAGAFGVEPSFTGLLAFNENDTTAVTYTELKGNPTGTGDAGVVVTKEHQVCLKCHSSYGRNAADIGAGTLKVANIASEFAPTDIANGVNNQNSWHPVIGPTTSPSGIENLAAPWNDAAGGNAFAGSQTMYCSDCHSGNSTDEITAKGPHGSSSSGKMLIANKGDAFCYSCHLESQYGNNSAFDTPTAVNSSGFSCAACVTTGASPRSGTTLSAASATAYSSNLHVYHASQTVKPTVCTDCHVAIPHGWKNKSLLATLGDLGVTRLALAASATGTTSGRYYEAVKIVVDEVGDNSYAFPATGAWNFASCGTAQGCHAP